MSMIALPWTKLHSRWNSFREASWSSKVRFCLSLADLAVLTVLGAESSCRRSIHSIAPHQVVRNIRITAYCPWARRAAGRRAKQPDDRAAAAVVRPHRAGGWPHHDHLLHALLRRRARGVSAVATTIAYNDRGYGVGVMGLWGNRAFGETGVFGGLRPRK